MRAARRLSDVVASHGEGPVWRNDLSELWLVDMLDGDIVRLGPDGAVLGRRHVGPVVAAVRPHEEGGSILATERGFAILTADDELLLLDEVWSDPTVRMNDGGCDTQGRFLCGSMAYDAAPERGALYRLEHDGRATPVLTGVTVSNGIAFDPSGSSLLYIDSATRQVRRYGLATDDGAWSEPEVVVELAPEEGAPDGLCLDAVGGFWVALWGGSAVRRYDATGTLTDVVELPVSQVTACALGGKDGATLFITTSRLGVDAEAEPDAGAVFAARAPFPGSPVLPARYSPWPPTAWRLSRPAEGEEVAAPGELE